MEALVKTEERLAPSSLRGAAVGKFVPEVWRVTGEDRLALDVGAARADAIWAL
jgi:hypothetical protein